MRKVKKVNVTPPADVMQTRGFDSASRKFKEMGLISELGSFNLQTLPVLIVEERENDEITVRVFSVPPDVSRTIYTGPAKKERNRQHDNDLHYTYSTDGWKFTLLT